MFVAIDGITLPLAVHMTYWIISNPIPCLQLWSVVKNCVGNAAAVLPILP
jgi:hypothetical protein